MKVKNGKLISTMETLNDILEIDGLPIESQFMIVEFYKKLEVIFDSYDKTRRKAYEKLALKNEDGKYINQNGEFLEDGTLVVPKERLGDLEKEIQN